MDSMSFLASFWNKERPDPSWGRGKDMDAAHRHRRIQAAQFQNFSEMIVVLGGSQKDQAGDDRRDHGGTCCFKGDW